MTSTAPTTSAVAPMDTTPATPAVAAATPAAADAAPSTPAAAAQPNAAPISADALNSALNKATAEPTTGATEPSADASDVPNFVAKLLQNTEMPSDEKLLQMGEKMLEQTQMSMQVQQEMQELRQRLARFESEQDTKSRQQVEQQVQLLEQALVTDPNNPAFTSNGVTKEVLEKFKQATMSKLAPEERDVQSRILQSVAAFGMGTQVTEVYESQPAVAQNNNNNHHDELARLRHQEQEARERAAMLERQQRQQQLAMRFANIQASSFRPAAVSMPIPTSPMSSSSSSSCGAMSQMFQSGRPMAAMPAHSAPMSVGGGGVSNFGTSPSVSQRMSEDTFTAAATTNAKRPADTSNDQIENPSKIGGGSVVMGRLSNDMAQLAQKARLFQEKQELAKKSKKKY